MTPTIMIQGAGSNVGKSMLVAGLCRAFARRGRVVRPFKPQNMSNNAAVTLDGGEIGRAQALQARAAGAAAHTDMNPVLLKPETDVGAQVVLRGERLTTVRARDYATVKPKLLAAVVESFERLSTEADLMIVEGAGSPTEINLRAGDIANMGFARAVGAPVILVGDIDRGGVIAQLVGAKAVLDAGDAAMIRGFVINKFRGDVALFDEGRRAIEAMTRWPCLGVAPWFADAHRLPAEDAADLTDPRSRDAASTSAARRIKIAAPALSRIANYDDFDPLRLEPDVAFEMVSPGRPLPLDADLIILPGSKSTRGDLAFFRAQGWDVDLQAHWRRGGAVLGICGGYQMLGRRIADPLGIEGPSGVDDGLGLLDVETEMAPDKTLTRVTGQDLGSGAPVSGYEIHIGRTDGPDCARAWLSLATDGAPAHLEGAASADGRVRGTYAHGLFAEDGFRAAFLAQLDASSSMQPSMRLSYDATVDATLDALADHLEAHLDLAAIERIARRAPLRP